MNIWLSTKAEKCAHFKYLSACSCNILDDDFASKKSSLISSISSFEICSFPLIFANKWEGVSNCTAYLKTDLGQVISITCSH